MSRLRRRLHDLTAELRARTAERDEALAQQNAIAEVLQVTNSSRGELAPVFDAILDRALRYCGAIFGSFVTYDGERFHLAADRGHPAFTEWIHGQKVFQPQPGTTMARMVDGETVIHVADAADDVGYRMGGHIRRALVEVGGFRTLLGVAIRKDERLLGAIHVYRQKVQPFSDNEIALLRNFAGQAVISLENARLYSDLVHENRDRRSAEDALRTSEERWRRFFEGSSAGIALADLDGVFTAANPAFQRMLGLAEHEILGRSAVEMSHPDDRSSTVDRISAFRRGVKQFHVEKRYLKRDGSALWLDLTTSLVPASEKTGAFLQAVYVDISDRKRAEEALRISEERWRRLFETSSAGMALATMEGRYIAANRAFQNMVGYTEDELKSLSPVELSFPDERASATRAIVDLASGKLQHYQIDRRFLRNDGTALWVNVTVSVVPGSEITPPVLQAIYIDIDDRKRAETALRASEERWRTVFEMAPVGIATFNLDQRFATANPALRRMLGYSEDELRQLKGADITEEEDRAASQSLNEDMVSGRRHSYQVEKRYRRKDGEIVWVNINSVIVPATESTTAFFTAMVLDITGRRRAEEALQRTQADLARVGRLTAVGELGASIAHEINQPLAAIIASGNASLRWLDSAQNLGRARASIGRIIDDANRASEIINRIRALTRNKSPEQIRLDLNEIVEEALAFTRIEQVARQIYVHKQLQADLPGIMGDRVQLQQVLLNLIMNALEAMTPVTGRQRKLTMMSRLTEDGAPVVTVQDTGHGLDSTQADRIFDAFFTTKPNGTGMGLSISASIIEAHGGRLWASSVEPYGAAFHFSLPAAVEDNP